MAHLTAYNKAQKTAVYGQSKGTQRATMEWGLILAGGNCGSSARYKLNNVGKTVFLTREAAEAALKEREAEHDR